MANGHRCEPFVVLGRSRGIPNPCFAVRCGGPREPTISLLIEGRASEPIGNQMMAETLKELPILATRWNQPVTDLLSPGSWCKE